jgi:hypothetical protein
MALLFRHDLHQQVPRVQVMMRVTEFEHHLRESVHNQIPHLARV